MRTHIQYTGALAVAVLLAGAPLLAQVVTQAPPPPPGVPGIPGAPGAPGQPFQMPSGVIAGTVLDAVTGAPISGAVVYLNREIRDAMTIRQARQLTDTKGRFAFVEVPPYDRYRLSAGQFGYFDGGFGASNEPGTNNRTLALADGQWITDQRVVLFRPAAISGVVTDETGEPVAGIYVRVMARISVAGRLHLASGPSATTDDRGVYRVSALPPGQYIVTVPGVAQSVSSTELPAQIAGPSGNATMGGGAPARVFDAPPPEPALDLGATTRLIVGRFAVPPPPQDGRLFTYPLAFYGGAGDIARAVPIDLKLGDERAGIDIKLEPVATTTISGVVQGSAESLARLTLRLLPAGLENAGEGLETATAAVAADGSFTFHGVPAGEYTIEAPPFIAEYLMNSSIFSGRPPTRLSGGSSSHSVAAGPPGTQFMRGRSRTDGNTWARVSVTVTSRPLIGVAIALRPAATMTGVVAFDPDPEQPGAARPTYSVVRAEPANGVPSLGQSDGRTDPATQEFLIEGLIGGQYLIRGNVQPPWQIKSVTVNGRDVTHQPVDTGTGRVTGLVVTVTNRPVEVSGTVRDAQGAMAPDAVVVFFPAEPAQRIDYGLSAPRFRSVSVRSDGTYGVATLPAGDYLAVAVPGTNPTVWQAPGFFKSVESLATRVTIGWGEKKTQDLRVTALPGGGRP